MSSSERPPVEQGQPPRSVLRVVNPVVSALLRSPLHRLLSREYMLLTVTGRKTGRSYTIPVGRHEFDGAFVVYAAGGWRHNLRGGADVRLTVDGHERTGHAELEEDPARVAQAYKERLDQLGTGKARQLGLKVNLDRSPTADEIRPAVAGRAVATIHVAA
jgi:hypothetical protein